MTWPAEGASRLATERSLPKWVVREWVATYGAAAASRIAAASNRPGPVTLRANVRRGDRRQLQASLVSIVFFFVDVISVEIYEFSRCVKRCDCHNALH